MASQLKMGFSEGFRLGYQGPRQAFRCSNMKSIEDNLPVAKQKVEKEVQLGRVAGPFEEPPLKQLRCSPLALIPKTEVGKFRLIHHLSFPQGQSVNDHIPDSKARVQYTKFDEALTMIAKFGKNALVGKADISEAFRLLPVNKCDFDLLGFTLEGKFYVDLCAPMGCRSSPSIWESFSTFLNWVLDKWNKRCNTKHYVDDFIFAGPANSPICQQALTFFRQLCKYLGIPVAEDKTVLPRTQIVFLGLQIDTQLQQVRIPPDKLIECNVRLHDALRKAHVTLRELQSLLGYLNYLCRAVAGGRTFLQRLVALTRGKSRNSKRNKIRLSVVAKADIATWITFLDNFNGTCMILPEEWLSSDVLQLWTDSAMSVGFSAYLKGAWFCGSWQGAGVAPGHSIAYLELFPIVLAMTVWGNKLANSRIIFHCDNQAVVSIINRQSSKCPHIMALLRRLVLTCLKNNITAISRHQSGKTNVICDALSRFQWERFKAAAPHADTEPTPIAHLLPLK